MPAPTALLRAPEKLAEEVAAAPPEDVPLPAEDDMDVDVVAAEGADWTTVGQNLDRATRGSSTKKAVRRKQRVRGLRGGKTQHVSKTLQTDMEENDENNNSSMQIESGSKPKFEPEAKAKVKPRPEARKVIVPPHRMSPLKAAWPKIYPPLVEHLKLQVRMQPTRKTIEMRSSKFTEDNGALQKGEDFIRAFCLGFDIDDSIALLRLDDLFIETFEIRDVKLLNGDHLARAIGRIAGKDGKTKFAIENATKTRISLEGQTVHILGRFQNIHLSREAVCSLVLGASPSKVYGNLRTVSARMKERF